MAGLLYAFYGTSPDLIAGSFNFEQFYIPFIIIGLALTESGPENIFLAGSKVKRFATLKKLSEEAKPFLEQVGLGNIDPATRTNLLSVGEQHLVEEARLISQEAKILILDEPTAALGEAESRRILDMVKKIAATGKSIIYISHRLDEIFKI